MRLGKHLSQSFSIGRDIAIQQGSVLSTTLFNLVIDPLDTPPLLNKTFFFFQKPYSIDNNFHSKVNITYLRWNCTTATAGIYSTHALTSNTFLVSSQALQSFIYQFVYQPTCTTLSSVLLFLNECAQFHISDWTP